MEFYEKLKNHLAKTAQFENPHPIVPDHATSRGGIRFEIQLQDRYQIQIRHLERDLFEYYASVIHGDQLAYSRNHFQVQFKNLSSTLKRMIEEYRTELPLS